MSMNLHCECGNQVSVDEAAAGASIPCSCGRAVAVPSLGQLRQMSAEVGIIPASQLPGPGLPAETHQATEQAVAAIYQFAATGMHNGTPDSEIARKLRDQGLDGDTANLVVEQTRAARGQVMREAGMKNMFIGGIVCVIGLVITVASYSAAANNPRGGSYVVAWGAVVFGAIQFFRGLVQMGTR